MTEQDTYVDQQNDTDEPLEKPEGAPELLPILRLPRRRRGAVVASVMRLNEAQQEFAGDSDAETVTVDIKSLSPERAERMFDLLADLEDVLRGVAADQAAFDAWAENADDGALSALFGFYMKTFQVGEASASSAS